MGRGHSYSLFIDEDEFHRSLSVVYVKTCSGKETQDVRTQAGVDPGVRGRGRGVIGDLLPFSLVCRYSGAVDTDRPPSFAIKLERLGQGEERGGTCKQSRKEVCAWVKGTWVMTAGMGKGRGMKMRGWAPGWAGSQWRLAGNGGGSKGGDELRGTVPMSSASSVLELPAPSCSSSALISSWSTASTMGITMAVVEVLESHMDSMVVQHMKHNSSLGGRDSGVQREPAELSP